jgi:hypothetical protein
MMGSSLVLTLLKARLVRSSGFSWRVVSLSYALSGFETSRSSGRKQHHEGPSAAAQAGGAVTNNALYIYANLVERVVLSHPPDVGMLPSTPLQLPAAANQPSGTSTPFSI